ncbi:D-alanyl-D-alanine carboxypeptidase, partial [Bacillus wiedmannii]
AGDMISTADDLNKFFSYLLGGKLLKEQQLKQMLTTVPTGREGIDGYGLGIYETKLPSGVSIWGHTGGILGFTTLVGGTLGGKHTLV